METNDIIFDQRTFDDHVLTCPKCGWNGVGADTKQADHYGIGKFKTVLCPKCDASLGNLSREHSFGEGK